MIVPTLARMIIREHLYKPIRGSTLVLGRQTVAMTYDEFLELLEQEKFFVPEEILKNIKIKYDNQTKAGKDRGFISDEIFFDLLGIKEVSNMDVSEYEGAEVIHDLNKPIPKSLENRFDFIIDGGTFDHLFDIRVAFQNVVKMLKPGGRIFQWNAASNFTGQAYLSFGPDIFYDYYTLNKFTDCKVYIAEVDDQSQKELWDIYEFTGWSGYRHFRSNRILMTLVLAEKGRDSTYDEFPIQIQYRDAKFKQIYEDRHRIISFSGRKPYQGSETGVQLTKSNIGEPARDSILNKIILKYKERGLKYVLRRVFEKSFSGQPKKKVPGGYRYMGKI